MSTQSSRIHLKIIELKDQLYENTRLIFINQDKLKDLEVKTKSLEDEARVFYVYNMSQKPFYVRWFCGIKMWIIRIVHEIQDKIKELLEKNKKKTSHN
jgi:hypothetical protein